MANNYLQFSVEFPINKDLIVDAIAIEKLKPVKHVKILLHYTRNRSNHYAP